MNLEGVATLVGFIGGVVLFVLGILLGWHKQVTGDIGGVPVTEYNPGRIVGLAVLGGIAISGLTLYVLGLFFGV